MTDDQQTGRVILVALIFVTLLISVVVIAVYIITRGLDRLETQGIRFSLEIALMTWLYHGSNAAKWIAVVLFGMGGLLALATILTGEPLVMAGGAIMGTVYLAIAGVLAASRSVNEFLEYQRNRGSV